MLLTLSLVSNFWVGCNNKGKEILSLPNVHLDCFVSDHRQHPLEVFHQITWMSSVDKWDLFFAVRSRDLLSFLLPCIIYVCSSKLSTQSLTKYVLNAVFCFLVFLGNVCTPLDLYEDKWSVGPSGLKRNLFKE